MNDRLREWFAGNGWGVFGFQAEVWEAYRRGESGLLHSSTGSGKTLAAWGGPLLDALDGVPGGGLRVLWVTPLRALATDTVESLRAPLAPLGLDWRVAMRTGDSTATERKRQAERMPEALVTTPESLTLMLSRAEAPEIFGGLRLVVVDEWHELLSTKRGVQTELALARLRGFRPDLRTWGLSATLGNVDEALAALVGPGGSGRCHRGSADREVVLHTVLPPAIDRFPWAGHLGVPMIPSVLKVLEEGGTTLVFCNTRAQAEIWFQRLRELRPKWANELALHHGSLDREVREAVEEGLRRGLLRAVVCTSSLDLGVDFSPVDQVIQIGSPKGVARLLQRAGRSGHRPGAVSRLAGVPTHALELLDLASARRAVAEGAMEARPPQSRPLDVLAQHLVTVAAGTGFREAELLEEVRSTWAYRELADDEWAWTLDFAANGGRALGSYPQYRRIELGEDGVYRVAKDEIAQRHRLSIGTITSDPAIAVQVMKGGRLGSVEESFVARLRPGDRFTFAGRPLELVRVKDLVAYVRPVKGTERLIPRWGGGRLPLSTELAASIRRTLDEIADGLLVEPELEALAPLLELQADWSAIPHQNEVLVERVETREGFHAFVFPIEGRLVHEGLAALCAFRLSRREPISISIAANDYGFEMLSDRPFSWDEEAFRDLFRLDGLEEDILGSLNSAELAKRHFREIARVAGLVFPGLPGQMKSAKQIQASSGLFYDTFARYDPENLLLRQAEREVLERQLEIGRLSDTLVRMGGSKLLLTDPPAPTPFAFPILVDRLRDTVTSESLEDRVARMVVEFEDMGRQRGAVGRA